MGSGLACMGDLHVSHHVYSKIPGMTGDTDFALKQFADYCKANDLDALFVGDNFDKQPDAALLAGFLYAMRDIDYAFIVGQHDMQPATQWPAVCVGDRLRVDLDEAALVGAAPVELGGMRVCGLNFTPRGRIKERLADIPPCDVLALHQTIKQAISIGDEDDAGRRWDMDVEWVPAHVGRIIIGDWHYPVDGITEAGQQWAYTGAATMRRTSELDAKSFIVVMPGVTNRRQPLLTRPVLYSDLLWPPELAQWCGEIKSQAIEAFDTALARGIPACVAAPLLVVRYSPTIDNAHDRIISTLSKLLAGGKAHLHELPVRAGDEFRDAVDAGGCVTSIQDVVDALVDKELSPRVHELVTELAHTPTPREAVVAFKRKYMAIDDPRGV